MRSLLPVILLTLLGCASIKPPPGGEEDKTPPTIDTTFPAGGATNVPLNIKPRILFEQNVDRTSFTQSVTLTPYMPGVIKYDWSGYDEVELELPEPLHDSTTYILTIGRDLKTRRAGQLNEPIQIIFSTGPSLDSGIITGQVFPSFQSTVAENFTSLFIFAYDLTSRNADTLNMTTTPPDYLTQPKNTGAFELKALKFGHRYRIIAVGDEFRNRLYDHTVDSYGIPSSDVLLAPGSMPPISIRMTPKIDTLHPKMEDVEVRDAYHFRVKFNKAIDSASVDEYNFELYHAAEESPGRVAAAYKEDPEKRPAVITLVPYSKLDPGATYTLHALNNMVRDARGLAMSPGIDTITFTVPVVPDTFSAPQFVRFSVADSVRDVPRLGDIKVFLSDAAERALLDTAFTLYDSSGRKTPIELRYGDDSRVTIRSRDSLLPRAYYRLEVRSLFIEAPAGNPAPIADTIYTLHFFTEDPREFGNVSGEVTYADSIYNPAAHRVVVQLVNTETNAKMRKVLSEGRIKYAFENVPPGRYRVRAWLTMMENNMWLGGKVQPFSPAMPTGEFPELIDVRSRWSVDDVNFELR